MTGTILYITSSLYPTTKVVGLLEDGIPDSLCFITRLKPCVFNESKIMIVIGILMYG